MDGKVDQLRNEQTDFAISTVPSWDALDCIYHIIEVCSDGRYVDHGCIDAQNIKRLRDELNKLPWCQ